MAEGVWVRVCVCGWGCVCGWVRVCVWMRVCVCGWMCMIMGIEVRVCEYIVSISSLLCVFSLHRLPVCAWTLLGVHTLTLLSLPL